MLNRVICLSSFLLMLMVVSCAPSVPQEESAPAISPTLTPTPEETPLNLAANTLKPEPPPITGGRIEIRIPYQLEGAIVTSEPGEGNECVYEMPFQLSQEGDRTMAHGSGLITCHWTIPPDPMPYGIHIIEESEASFDGEVFPPSDPYPKGWIDGYMNVDGTVTQYYVDVPAEIPNLCPESSPCVVPGTVVFSLPFPWEEGSKIEQKWIFILHLGEG
jgi:hypothetical protein